MAAASTGEIFIGYSPPKGVAVLLWRRRATLEAFEQKVEASSLE
jgi:hypothetical protein